MSVCGKLTPDNPFLEPLIEDLLPETGLCLEPKGNDETEIENCTVGA